MTTDVAVARRLLELVPDVPTATWGRDELRTGQMWNSNAVVSWLIIRAGLDPRPRRRPPGVVPPGGTRESSRRDAANVATSQQPQIVRLLAELVPYPGMGRELDQTPRLFPLVVAPDRSHAVLRDDRRRL